MRRVHRSLVRCTARTLARSLALGRTNWALSFSPPGFRMISDFLTCVLLRGSLSLGYIIFFDGPVWGGENATSSSVALQPTLPHTHICQAGTSGARQEGPGGRARLGICGGRGAEREREPTWDGGGGMPDDLIGAGENLFGRQRRRLGNQNLDIST